MLTRRGKRIASSTPITHFGGRFRRGFCAAQPRICYNYRLRNDISTKHLPLTDHDFNSELWEKSMKTKTFATLTAMALAITLAACGQQAQQSADKAKDATSSAADSGATAAKDAATAATAAAKDATNAASDAAKSAADSTKEAADKAADAAKDASGKVTDATKDAAAQAADASKDAAAKASDAAMKATEAAKDAVK
ncbi:MAG: hypothetical protein M3R40_08465, partial [Pseudomonadota bacterium]|nr:hypothetical protein [Pseudomonadota bacterium]